MRRRVIPSIAIVFSLLGTFLSVPIVAAQQTPNDFAIEITPSPVVETIKPGVSTSFDLQVHNKGSGKETLKIAARKFTIDDKTGIVRLDDTTPAEAAQWTKFSASQFSIDPGQWYTQHVTIALPKDTGFSYSYAIVITRAATPSINGAGRALQGSVADFTLINVDKPGATRKLDITDISTDQQVYEFLPAKINIKFKNTGNTIIAPAGNLFFQRGSNDTKPLSTADINTAKGYILPGTERTYTASWDNGFPVFKTTTADDGSSSTNLFFDWNNLTNFRFGQYTAKVVAVYNDGQRDIPITREVTFWVIPYKTIALVIIILIALGLVVRKWNERRTQKAVKKALAAHEKHTKKSS